MASHVLTVTNEGQIIVPEELSRELGFEAGDRVHVERDATGLHIETARQRDLAVARRTDGSMSGYVDNSHLTIEEIIAAEKEAFAQAIVDDYLETERRIHADRTAE